MSMNTRYRCIIDDPYKPTKVIVLSKYAGKDVRGVAKCSPNDKFNLETGETLAKLRCDAKVALKRMRRSEKKLIEARKQLEEAAEFLERMEEYNRDAANDWRTVMEDLYQYEKEIL